MLKIVTDTFSPRLKEIDNQLEKYSRKAIQDAHNVYKKIQYPLVPISDNDDTGHAGRLLSSMDRFNYGITFGKSVSIQFGFYAYEDGMPYARLQEENPYGWKKHVRYAGHNPIDGYFREGISLSQEGMFNAIHKKFGELLK